MRLLFFVHVPVTIVHVPFLDKSIRPRSMSLTHNSDSRAINATTFMDSFTIRVKHPPIVHASVLIGCSAKVMPLLQREGLTNSSSLHLGRKKMEGGAHL